MTAAKKLELLDWQDYLRGEESAQRRHEFVHGFVYAMAGGTYEHSLIATNIVGALMKRLGQGRCRVLNSDFKVRIRTDRGIRFYYPDCSVFCTQIAPNSLFADEPVVVVEVLSPSTRRLDQGEKREGYLSIPSLAVYLLVDSERSQVALWRRRGANFDSEAYTDAAASIALPEIGVELPLVEIYANVDWTSLPASDEESDA